MSAVSVLGLGAMGRALAAALLAAGHDVTIWNRTAGRAAGLAEAGAAVASTVEDAVRASPVVIVCLLDEASVREQLDPVADALRGRDLVNLTTTTPDEARALATWATCQQAAYVDGGIMAVPAMIGGPASLVLYSGDTAGVERHRAVLEAFGRAAYVGTDAGAAAMYDTAMLGAMYAMFAGFEQGGRMVRTAGGTAGALAAMLTPFLQAMAEAFGDHAAGIDSPADYVPEQSAEFTAAAIDLINRAGAEAGQRPDLLAAARALLTERPAPAD